MRAWPAVALLMVVTVGCSSGSNNSSPPSTSQTNSVAKSVMAEKDTAPVAATQSPQDLAAQADVPVYPGALFPDKMTRAPSKDDSGKMHTYLVMSTGDAPAKVVKFYLGSPGHYSEMKTKDGSQIQGLSPKGNLVLIDVTQQNGLTMIGVKSVQGS